jgi:hypothetical protein
MISGSWIILFNDAILAVQVLEQPGRENLELELLLLLATLTSYSLVLIVHCAGFQLEVARPWHPLDHRA